MGLNVPVDPWIEGWLTHSSLGVNTTTGGTSNWITLEYKLCDNGITVEASVDFLDSSGTSLIPAGTTSYTATSLASGTTLYTGFSTNWNNVGDVGVGSYSKLSSVNIDNFIVTSVPEPTSFLLVTVGLVGCIIPRRRK